MPWYAVRSFFHSLPVGRPHHPDEGYLPGIASVEERIVLFKARDSSTAFKRADAEAKKYARGRDRNVYGQPVVTTRLPFWESFELFDPPNSGVEVFSSIEIVSKAESAAHILTRKIGKPAGPDTARVFITAAIAQTLDSTVPQWTSATPPRQSLRTKKSHALRHAAKGPSTRKR
jgi:hypothetical protein